MDKKRICPVEHAGILDISIRKLIHNPEKILYPYISNGMTVVDLGCGPGFFTIEIAKMVGNSGQVIAADLQEGMLEKVKQKSDNSLYKKIIKTHKCQSDKIGIIEKADLIFIFYILHEVPDQNSFIKEVKTILKPEGKIFVAEPAFHVSKKEFNQSIDLFQTHGFEVLENPKVFFSRTSLLKIIN